MPTLTQLAARLSNHLGLDDVTTDAAYSSVYLAEMNRAQDDVGRDIHWPIEEYTQPNQTTVTFTINANARPDMVLAARVSGAYGDRPVPVVGVEARRQSNIIGYTNAPPRMVVLAQSGSSATLEPWPNPTVSLPSTVYYTAIAKATDLVGGSDVPWGGSGPSWHFLIPLKASIAMLKRDGRPEEAKENAEEYERQRVQAILELHATRLLTPHIKRLLAPKEMILK